LWRVCFVGVLMWLFVCCCGWLLSALLFGLCFGCCFLFGWFWFCCWVVVVGFWMLVLVCGMLGGVACG
jgi:hypothetical protein